MLLLSAVLSLSLVVLPTTVDARDPIKQSCNFTNNQVVTKNTGQVSGSIFSWGIQLTTTGANLFGTPVAVKATSGTVTKPSLEVRSIPAGSIYDIHIGNQYDIFHGSISNYNYSGSPTNATLASGDIINLKFSVDGPNLADGVIEIECKMP
ncbi:hypothetical protein [Paenibacillus riograndensis]|uniref:hypothetical protein n=1 Tax=Paenibacillus riograndensis TaxID=483937 RepID=UPI000A78F368|nr:hypothetical protein [Paenibacillus riograndensis]